MGRIRLQVCVLPWERPDSSTSHSAQARQEVKWCEPCTEDTPMQGLCDKIYKSWERMFKETMGPLKIRHLKTAYGDFLDLQERVVGDFFDDRGADGNIRNSILEVHRYPPTPDQLETLQRFSTLAPTSSVRPRKRPLELPSQLYPSQFSQSIHREIPSIEEWDAEATTSFGTATKRQRTHESRLNKVLAGHPELNMREEQGGEPLQSSQTSQESIHQVLDSQKSPGKKHTNPYGTPSSLTLVGPQESLPSSEIDLSAIPDSPLGRESTSARGAIVGAIQIDRESTKSESPELRISVHEVPPTGSIDTSRDHPITSAISSESSRNPSATRSGSKPVPISQDVDEYARDHGLSIGKTSEEVADVNRAPKSRLLDPAYLQSVQTQSNIVRESDAVFDPIESDTESFHEKQQMQSAKRLRSSKTPTASFNSFRASNIEWMNRRDGQFLVPPLPLSRINGTRKPSCETTNLGQRENNPMLWRDPKDVDTGVQNDLDRHGKHNSEITEDAQSNGCNNDRLDMPQETPKGKTMCNNLVDTNLTSSQATTACSKDCNTSVNGTAKSVAQQRNNNVSIQNQGPDETTHLGHDVDAVVTNLDDSHSILEVEWPVGKAEEQQAKVGVGQKEVDQKRQTQMTMEEEKVAGKKAAERRAEDEKSAVKQGAKEKKASAEESAQAEIAKAKKQELADAKRIEEARANERRLSEQKEISERLARERQLREASLAEEANKAMLAADGARQIEAEILEKEKARHKELAAKKQANDAKADAQAREARGKAQEKKAREAQRAREKAQKLADSECKEAEEPVLPARTNRQTATAVREQAQKRIADREARNSADPKRSMTPRLPGSISSSIMDSLRSTPQSNRSSGNMDAPLRSALRKTPNALGRSVSSVSFDVPQRANVNEHIASTPNPKSLEVTNKDCATKPSSATKTPTIPPRTTSNPPSKTPMKSIIPKKVSGGKVTKTPAKTGKVQTQLNVTREPKKLKGRAAGPPTESMQTPKQKIVISSGEDSSSSDTPVWQTGNAQPGPSSRKPTLPATSQIKKTAEAQSSGVRIDPNIRNVNIEKNGTAAPAALPRRRISTLDTASVKNSISRSPAMVLSETISMSSGSASSAASEAGLESELKEELQAPSSKTPTDTKSETRASGTIKGVSKAVNIGVKQPEDHLRGKALSHSISQVPSSRSHSMVATNGDTEHIDQAANKQLQCETRHSIPSSRVDRSSSSINGAVGYKVINQGLDHAGRLPNGIRPAYYKYPTLTELQKVPRAGTPKAEPRLDTFSSQQVGASPVSPSGSDDSSSDSDSDNDERSSKSDEDEEVDRSRVTTWSRKPFPGMRSLTKMANALRSTYGSSQ